MSAKTIIGADLWAAYTSSPGAFRDETAANQPQYLAFTAEDIAKPAEKVEMWTDGGCDPNPGPGGWAVCLRYSDSYEEFTGGDAGTTTNNRMELTAAIKGLQQLKRPHVVTLTTDSQYVGNGISSYLPAWIASGWRGAGRKLVKDQDLWVQLLSAMRIHQVKVQWVRGHSGDPMNTRADSLVQIARQGAVSRAA
jgi:ribonuclease HI